MPRNVTDNVRTHSLHDIFESVEADVACCRGNLGIHSHGEALKDRGQHEGPLAPDERHLHRHQRKEGTDDSWRVDDDILLIGILHGTATAVDVVTQQDKWQKTSCEVEGPVISLQVCFVSIRVQGNGLVQNTYHVRNGQEHKDQGRQLVGKDAL